MAIEEQTPGRGKRARLFKRLGQPGVFGNRKQRLPVVEDAGLTAGWVVVRGERSARTNH